MDTSAPIVLPLRSEDATLAMFGGKGRSLARLASAGLPIPDGFILSTDAYRDFVQANALPELIRQILADARHEQAASVELASVAIQSLFEAAKLPSEIAESIMQAYAAMGEHDLAVAVRSSATAEDLPDLSFAGQQDSFLNIRGDSALVEAVRNCWASLWNPRAISYRMQMGIDQHSVTMGVVVQVMVAADVSGILFTANPATGDRSELVVNASFGLGEAVVGGNVSPDAYVLDRDNLETKESLIGGKEEMVVFAVEQGTVTKAVPEEKRNVLSLSPAMLSELAVLSLEAEAVFDGRPQDVEWSVADGKVWLLQSRPITNLRPPSLSNVAWDPPSEGAILVRRQVVENMPAPLSPLFDELYLGISLENAIDQFLVDFGVRMDFEVFMERPFFLSINGYAYCRGSYRFSWRMLRFIPNLLYVYIKVVPQLLSNIKTQWRDEALPEYLKTIQQWKSVNPDAATSPHLLEGVRALAIADASYWFTISMMVAGAKVTDGLLNRYLHSWFVPGNLTSGMFLRGFPSKTIDAQFDLEAIATRIQDDPSLCKLVRTTPAGQLLDAMRHNPRARSTFKEIQTYFETYGHQVYNLDFAEPTQGEDPSAVLLSLRALVSREGADAYARQAELVQDRDALIEQTLSSLGPIRRWLFRKCLSWAQSFGPCREDALFYMGAAWSTLRRLALELGHRLVAAGTLTEPDDVFYLESAELVAASAAQSEDRARTDLRRIVAQRRELRESRKRLHPPAIIPVGSRWKLGPFDMSVWETQKRNAADAVTLHGFAVSPGTVTGVATVILSPADFEQMRPDTILVCPTTTPAWTPLFGQALGLVTDIGGILAHGSIVAREYGIPAVLGTGNGTERIVTGQRITVNGDTGTVAILS